MPEAKGIMGLDGKALAKIVDDCVAALRITNPTWIGWFGDGLPARVQEILLESAAEARQLAEESHSWAWCGTGGIEVGYDPDDGKTAVRVELAAVWDEPEDPPHSDGDQA